MSTTILFARSHSRNPFDWTMKRTKDGRFIFLANDKGVFQRVGHMIKFIHKDPMTPAEMLEYLRTELHKSFNIHDVNHGFRRLVQHSIAESKEGRFRLTNNGNRIWKAAHIVWIPREP